MADVKMFNWSVIRVNHPAIGHDTDHLLGEIESGRARITSAIQYVDGELITSQTRKYEICGLPASSAVTSTVKKIWLAKNGLKTSRDVTDEYMKNI